MVQLTAVFMKIWHIWGNINLDKHLLDSCTCQLDSKIIWILFVGNKIYLDIYKETEETSRKFCLLHFIFLNKIV